MFTQQRGWKGVIPVKQIAQHCLCQLGILERSQQVGTVSKGVRAEGGWDGMGVTVVS